MLKKKRMRNKELLENPQLKMDVLLNIIFLEEMAIILKSQDQIVEFDKMEDKYSYHKYLRYIYIVVFLYKNLF